MPRSSDQVKASLRILHNKDKAVREILKILKAVLGDGDVPKLVTCQFQAGAKTYRARLFANHCAAVTNVQGTSATAVQAVLGALKASRDQDIVAAQAAQEAFLKASQDAAKLLLTCTIKNPGCCHYANNTQNDPCTLKIDCLQYVGNPTWDPNDPECTAIPP
jgi:hypothetical protein